MHIDYVTLLPAAVTAAVVAVFFYWRSPDERPEQRDWVRPYILYFGVPLVGLGILLGFSLGDYPGDLDGGQVTLIVSTYVGWIILSIALLLPSLLRLPVWLYRTGLTNVSKK